MPKRKRINNNVRFIIFLLVLAVIAATTIFFTCFNNGGDAEDVVIIIPAGSGVIQISEILNDANVVSSARNFRRYVLDLENIDNIVFQQGNHIVNRNMSNSEIVEVLQRIPQPILPDGTVRVTIPEGFELREIVERLYALNLIDRDIFMDEVNNGEFDFDFVRAISYQGRVNRLEGYLFPATYDILPDDTEWDIINKMLQAFNNRVVPLYNELNPSQTLDEIIIMASIVEKEAVNDGERATVSGIIYNRTRAGWLLEFCSTVKYTFDLGTRPAILSNAQVRVDTPYNTYMHPGLPIGPIANPGLASIRAAMEPESHNYFFMSATIEGDGHIFSRTLAEHNAAARAREQANR